MSDCIIDYDITERKSFEKVRDWMEQIRQSDPTNETCKILIGNKCDLEGERQVSTEEGHELAKELDVPFLETSAKDNSNVEQVFVDMAAAMQANAGVLATGVGQQSWVSKQIVSDTLVSVITFLAQTPN